MPKSETEITSGLSWLEKLLQLYKKYGIWNIFKALLVLLLVSFTIRICIRPEFLFDKYVEYMKSIHTQELQIRTEKDQQIKNLLPTYLYRYRADRVWIIQYHNGIMDWQHGTMRFELCRNNIPSIKDQYNGFNLTWLNLPYYLMEHEMFIGDTASLQELDHVLYTQFVKNKISYIACTVIRDSNNYPIGIFGVTWCCSPSDIEQQREKIMAYLIESRIELRKFIQID